MIGQLLQHQSLFLKGCLLFFTSLIELEILRERYFSFFHSRSWEPMKIRLCNGSRILSGSSLNILKDHMLIVKLYFKSLNIYIQRCFQNPVHLQDELFCKIVNGWKPLSITVKLSISGLWVGSEYAYEINASAKEACKSVVTARFKLYCLWTQMVVLFSLIFTHFTFTLKSNFRFRYAFISFAFARSYRQSTRTPSTNHCRSWWNFGARRHCSRERRFRNRCIGKEKANASRNVNTWLAIV